ncbi:MAG TPA: four helix bundle protein [Prolixibacteraceae bacterium]|nr:four helix bundle protein [Prolixibacteraceae bacterium]
MNSNDLKKRLKLFALRIIRLSERLPNTNAGYTIGRQIIRSGTSPGANYRSACLGKSDRDFLNKLKMVEEELDETAYWIELLIESGQVKVNLLESLLKENNELLKIIVSSITTIKKKLKDKKNNSKNETGPEEV